MIAGLSLLIFSCIERIDIELDNSYTRLVVDGVITTDTMAHTIFLSESTSYYYNQPAPAVSGAEVQISDGIADLCPCRRFSGYLSDRSFLLWYCRKNIYTEYKTCNTGRRIY